MLQWWGYGHRYWGENDGGSSSAASSSAAAAGLFSSLPFVHHVPAALLLFLTKISSGSEQCVAMARGRCSEASCDQNNAMWRNVQVTQPQLQPLQQLPQVETPQQQRLLPLPPLETTQATGAAI